MKESPPKITVPRHFSRKMAHVADGGGKREKRGKKGRGGGEGTKISGISSDQREETFLYHQ